MKDKSGQIALLFLAVFAIALSFLLDIRHNLTVLPLVGESSMPRMCLMHTLTGLDCPFCGLTRGFVHLAHGRLYEACEINAAAPAVFLFVLLQIPYRIYVLAKDHEVKADKLLLSLPWIIVVCGLVIHWIIYLAAKV